MEPTIHCGMPGIGCLAARPDTIFVQEPVRTVKRHEVVAFNAPSAAEHDCGSGGVYVLRVVALPGEMWAERAGYVFIDGRKLAEPYVKPGYRDTESVRARTIPPDSYFVMGDNRSGSCDSRRFGAVPIGDIVGIVVKIGRPG